MSNYESLRRESRAGYGLTMFGVGAVAWLILVTGAALLASYKGAEYKCVVEGPHHPQAFPLEAGPVSAGFTLWPMGRECEWPTAGADTVVAYTNNWGPTVSMVALAGLSVSGIVVAAVPRRRRPDSDWPHPDWPDSAQNGSDS